MPTWSVWSRRAVFGSGAFAFGLASCISGHSLPDGTTPRDHEATPQEAAIEQRSVCVGSTVLSAGKLGPVLYYRSAELPDGRLAVGYYAFFSQERPWGNNWMTWLVLPALAVDLVYTRSLLIAPGLQRVAYGKGDVEGFRIVYDVSPEGELVANHAVADDGWHREQSISRDELFAIDPKQPTVYTDTWSHHLGAQGARSADRLKYRKCYSADAIRPLPVELVRDYRLDRRALPAAVGPLPRERTGRAYARRAPGPGEQAR